MEWLRDIILIIPLALMAYGSSMPQDLANGTDTRITGGQIAPEGAYPYQVSLRKNGNQHDCMGSILNKRWILTAAHCTLIQPEAVVAGTNRVSVGGTRYNIEQIINHEYYNQVTYENDISLIKVSTDIVFTSVVQPIGLASQDPVPGSIAVASGFGGLVTGALPTDEMYFVHLKIISNEECQGIMNKPIPATTICTSQPSKGICQGDSGGGLVESGVVVGVVSWSAEPCGTNADGYSRVTSYRNWIDSKIQ